MLLLVFTTVMALAIVWALTLALALALAIGLAQAQVQAQARLYRCVFDIVSNGDMICCPCCGLWFGVRAAAGIAGNDAIKTGSLFSLLHHYCIRWYVLT